MATTNLVVHIYLPTEGAPPKWIRALSTPHKDIERFTFRPLKWLRNTPNTDPEYEGGTAKPTYEFYHSKGDATVMQFMITTSSLNSYAHTYMMPSGKMHVQANISTSVYNGLQ